MIQQAYDIKTLIKKEMEKKKEEDAEQKRNEELKKQLDEQECQIQIQE